MTKPEFCYLYLSCPNTVEAGAIVTSLLEKRLIVCAKQMPVTSNYWVLDFFPALVCLGFVLRACAWRGLTAFAAMALVLSGANGYLNDTEFYEQSRNPPERRTVEVFSMVHGRPPRAAERKSSSILTMQM